MTNMQIGTLVLALIATTCLTPLAAAEEIPRDLPFFTDGEYPCLRVVPQEPPTPPDVTVKEDCWGIGG